MWFFPVNWTSCLCVHGSYTLEAFLCLTWVVSECEIIVQPLLLRSLLIGSDRSAWLLHSCVCIFHNLALTRLSFSEHPLPCDIMGCSLEILLSNGCHCIKSIKIKLRFCVEISTAG